jgi:hypothetical protein
LDGQVFSHSLFSLKGNDLRFIYALICKTNSMNLLSFKTMEFLSIDEQDHLQRHITQVVKELEDSSEKKLRYKLFIEITKILGIKGVNYLSKEDVEHQAAIIIDETYKLTTQEYNYQKSEDLYETTKLQKIIIFQVDRLLKDLHKIQLDTPREVNPLLAAQLIRYIKKHLQEKQGEIQTLLSLPRIDLEVMEDLLKRKSLEWILNCLKGLEGSSFYFQIAPYLFSILRSIKSQGKVSQQQDILDPSITSYLLGFNQILWNLNHNDLQKRILPIVIMQMTIFYLLNNRQEDEIDYAHFIQESKSRNKHYQQLKDSLIKIEDSKSEIKETIQSKAAQIEQLKTNISKCLNLLDREKSSILSELKITDLNLLDDISRTFNEHKAAYLSTQGNINSIKNAQVNFDDQGSIFKRVGHSVTSLYRGYNLIEEEKKMDLLLKKMVEDIIQSNSSFKQKEREKINQLLKLFKQLNEEKMREEKSKFNLESELDSLNKHHMTQLELIKEFERDNYGIEDFPKSPDDSETRENEKESNTFLWQEKLAFLHNYEQRLKHLEEQHQNALQEIADYEKNLKTVNAELAKKQEEIIEISPYKIQAEQLASQKDQLIKKHKQLIEEHEYERNRQLQQQQSDWPHKYESLKLATEEQNEKRLSIVNQEWQAKYADLEGTNKKNINKLLSEIQQLSQLNKDSEQSIRLLKQHLEEKGKQLQTLLEQRDDRDNRINQLNKRVHQLELDKEELIKINQTLLDQQVTNAKHETLELEWNRKLADLTNKYETTINQQTQEHEEVIQKLEKAISDQEIAANQLVQDLNADWDGKFEELRLHYETQTKQQDDEKQRLIQALETAVADHEKATEQLVRELNSDWNSRLVEQQEAYAFKTEQQLAQLDSEWNQKLFQLTNKYESKIQELMTEIEERNMSKSKSYFEGELFDIEDMI